MGGSAPPLPTLLSVTKDQLDANLPRPPPAGRAEGVVPARDRTGRIGRRQATGPTTADGALPVVGQVESEDVQLGVSALKTHTQVQIAGFRHGVVVRATCACRG